MPFTYLYYNQMIKILSHASRWSLRCCNSEVLDFATSKIFSTSLTSHHPEQLNHLNLAFLGLSLSFSFHSVLCWKKRILRLFLPSLLCCTSRVVQLFFIWVANKNESRRLKSLNWKYFLWYFNVNRLNRWHSYWFY